MDISENVEAFLTTIEIPIRLACTTESGWPLVLSLWFLYRDGKLYCATQQDAKVTQHLRRDPRCAFEIAADEPPYCGVRGQAEATLDTAQGEPILRELIERYLGSTDKPLAKKLLSQSDTEVAIIIEPKNLFQWNFAPRMKDSISGESSKPCP